MFGIFQILSLNFIKLSNPFEIKYSESVKRLHKLTKYETFYDLLDLRNNCTNEDVETAYREKLMDKKFLSEIPLIEKRRLMGDAVNLLTKNRSAYDKELNQVDILNFNFSKTMSVIFSIIFVIFTLLFVDLLILFFKYQTKRNKIEDLSPAEKAKLSSLDYKFDYKDMFVFKLLIGNKMKKD